MAGLGRPLAAAEALGLTPEVLARLDRLSLPARRPLLGSGAGQRRSPRPGTSLELADFRTYVPGDDFRRVDWNAYARLERLLLRLYVGEQDVCVTTWVDVSASMAWASTAGASTAWASTAGASRAGGSRAGAASPAGASPAGASPAGASRARGSPAGGSGPGGSTAAGPFVKERCARGLAGALVYLALHDLDRAACVGFAEAVVGRAGPLRGRGAAVRLWEELVSLPRGAGTDWSVLARAARSVPRGISCVVSDFLTEEDPGPAVAALRQAGHDVVLLQVLAPEERQPGLRGDLALVDVETGARVEVTATAGVVAAYRVALDEHQARLAAMAGAHGAGFASLDAGVALGDLVVGLLSGPFRRGRRR
ncbi:MAG: DUF58 domain-containing protein [Acidimicrobiales bacterium]